MLRKNAGMPEFRFVESVVVGKNLSPEKVRRGLEGSDDDKSGDKSAVFARQTMEAKKPPGPWVVRW